MLGTAGQMTPSDFFYLYINLLTFILLVVFYFFCIYMCTFFVVFSPFGFVCVLIGQFVCRLVSCLFFCFCFLLFFCNYLLAEDLYCLSLFLCFIFGLVKKQTNKQEKITKQKQRKNQETTMQYL